MKALVVASGADRITSYMDILVQEGCDAVAATEAFDALALLRRHQFDLVIVDESLHNMLPLEFTLTLRDMRVHQPIAIVASPSQQRTFQRLASHLRTEFVGSLEEAMHYIPEAVRLAESRTRHARL